MAYKKGVEALQRCKRGSTPKISKYHVSFSPSCGESRPQLCEIKEGNVKYLERPIVTKKLIILIHRGSHAMPSRLGLNETQPHPLPKLYTPCRTNPTKPYGANNQTKPPLLPNTMTQCANSSSCLIMYLNAPTIIKQPCLRCPKMRM